ncbi:kinase-like domain-containing protein, partial [Chytriomyces sp. MP71]
MLAADSERTLVHQPLASSTATENARKAVKRLFKEGLDQRQLRLQRHEVLIMNEIGPHSNIVPLIGTVEDEKSLYLVMDYCEMGKWYLYDAITKRGGFSERAVKNIFAQIVDAVIHCHSKGYYHRDLKPENCLIVSKSAAPNDYAIKLTDFGLATSDTWSTEMGCGSVRYMAPESRTGGGMHNPFSSRTGYPPASSDVWSLGVILINLLFAKNPWFEAHPTDPIFSAFVGTNPNILRAQFNLSPHFDALLRRCFDLDPRRRCSVHDLKVLVETMPRF